MSRELINRDPFCPVQLHPVQHRGKDTDSVLVEMQSEEGTWEAISGTGKVHGQDYVLVPNRQVFDMAGDILTRCGGDFAPVPEWGNGHSKAMHWDGKRFSAKWFSKDIGGQVGRNTVALGIEAVNSYDGSEPVGIRFFAMNCLCSNQFHMTHMLGNFVFRHVTREAGVQLGENVTDALQLLRQQADRFMKFLPYMKEMREKTVGGLQGFGEMRKRANERFWKASRDAAFFDELFGQNTPIDADAPVDSYWRILNAYTAVATHTVGGFNGDNLSGAATAFVFKEAGIDTTKDPVFAQVPA